MSGSWRPKLIGLAPLLLLLSGCGPERSAVLSQNGDPICAIPLPTYSKAEGGAVADELERVGPNHPLHTMMFDYDLLLRRLRGMCDEET